MSRNKITLPICSWKQPIQFLLLKNGEINLKRQARSLRPLVKWLGLNLMGMGLLLGLLVPLPVLAANYECTEAGLDAALAAGDMAATFNCVGPTTITITTPKVVTQDTGLDGDGLLTISGGDSLRVFSVTTGITLNLNDITISNGRVISDNGGAIYNNGTLILNNSTITNNIASGDASIPWTGGGGGIYNNGTAIISNSLVASNTASTSGLFQTGFGGGIANSDLGILTIISSTLKNNAANGRPAGGAILNRNSLSVSGCQFVENSASYGGAVEIAAGQAVINASTFISNTADDGGGALYNAGLNITVSQNTFSDNTANRGGAVFIQTGSITFRANTFKNNTAQNEGGAIWTNGGFGGTTILNSTFSDNHSNWRGGGIYVNYGDIALTNSTLADNTATHAGGNFYVADTPTQTVILKNTLVVSGTPDNCGSEITSLGYNLDDGNTCNLTATGDMTNTNPLLGPLQDNGGPTLTRALLPGSPAINAGDNTSCPTTDQRGVIRSQNGICDIGAYEAAMPVVSSLNPTSTTVGEAGFTLTLIGTDFVSETVVLWAGSVRPTSYISSTSLSASIDSGDLTTAGVITVSVRNPGDYISNGLPFTINRANTTTTVESSLNPSQFGQEVTFTATVSSGVETPTGTVTFYDDGTELGTSDLADGAATLAISTLGAENHPITAEYNGSANLNTSTGTLTDGQTVSRASTTTTVESSLNPSQFGQEVTFTATVSSGVETPTGTVTFYDDGTELGTSDLADGAATLAISTLGAENHPITAEYNGSANLELSTGVLAGGQTVSQVTQTITFAPLAPRTVGDPSFSVTATASSGLAVSFTAAGNCTVASDLVTITGPGSCTITAHQAGNTNYTAAPDVSQTFMVNVKICLPIIIK